MMAGSPYNNVVLKVFSLGSTV